MNEITLKQILEEMCLEEANEFENMKNIPHHHFPLRHRWAMKRILSVNNQLISSNSRGLRILPPTKRIVILTLLIFLAIFTITAGAVAINGFIRKRHHDNTQLFAVNSENSPSKIEYEYYLPEIPSGYELQNKVTTPFSVCSIFVNPENGNTLTFYQDVKNEYDKHFDTERAVFEEMDINGNYGLYLDIGGENREHGDLVWDNGDYILEIAGDLNKITLSKLAKSVKILENYKTCSRNESKSA